MLRRLRSTGAPGRAAGPVPWIHCRSRSAGMSAPSNRPARASADADPGAGDDAVGVEEANRRPRRRPGGAARRPRPHQLDAIAIERRERLDGGQRRRCEHIAVGRQRVTAQLQRPDGRELRTRTRHGAECTAGCGPPAEPGAGPWRLTQGIGRLHDCVVHRPALRVPSADEPPGRHRRRGALARARDRRQHRHLLAGQRGVPVAAPGGPAGGAGGAVHHRAAEPGSAWAATPAPRA